MIVDSNIVIYFLTGQEGLQKYFLNKSTVISFISELEILSGQNLTAQSLEKAKVLISKYEVIGYLPELKDIVIKLRSQKKLKLPDAIIAATAIYFDYPLISSDKGFSNIEGLDFIYHEPTSLNLQLNSLSNLPAAANQILNFAGNQRIFLFYGEMGAGKTTLIKSLCEQLGVDGAVTSPTFSIVNEYAGANANVYHFDFYRLKNQSEAFDMGYEEYFYSGAYCFVEWPEKIADLLPEHYLKINVIALDLSSREIVAQHV